MYNIHKEEKMVNLEELKELTKSVKKLYGVFFEF